VSVKSKGFSFRQVVEKCEEEERRREDKKQLFLMHQEGV
jgi:hypothetical protein